MKLVPVFCLLLFVLYQFLKSLHRVVRKKHIAQRTGLLDLPLLGAPRKDSKKIGGTAVICGGSIAGLLTARVCHDHFERVVIIEAENWLSTECAWPDNTSELKNKRSRLVQWEALQALQAWSASCFSKLFPNLVSECALSRIPMVPADWKYFLSGKEIKTPIKEYKGNLPPVLCAGRPSLETLLRRLVVGRNQYPNIQLIQGTVTGCEIDSENPKYLSKVLYRRASDSQTIAIPATMIIDCTGPARAGMKMLRRLGYGTATTNQPSLDDLTTHYNQNVHYSSFDVPATDDLIQRLPVEARKPGTTRWVPDLMKESRAILFQRIDSGIFQVVAAGWGLKEHPHDLDEVEAFARSLKFEIPIPEWWYDALHLLKEAENKMTKKIASMPPNIYTAFHRAGNMPSNWIAVGDSIMTINPMSAQGISKILLGVATLNSLLHKEGPGRLTENFANQFFHAQAEKIEPMWRSVKGVDYYFDTTTPIAGETLSTDWFIRSYIRAFLKLATKNNDAGSIMWHVFNFLAPPIDYFHPYFVPRVLLEMIRERMAV
ncbi:hypothetical protein M378DRAFT_16991 [Amanita muscaria Koide BX008]|uniref:Uncharacterized protein n=1 Tax=Amanita muscaria (strain Koide BX008) TaxID=946122 RepID=A0A0C2S1Q3_AMAMK|nr:hypothetical protein M378DRAFT_16991 [Amanita muscaria Koide BX008]